MCTCPKFDEPKWIKSNYTTSNLKIEKLCKYEGTSAYNKLSKIHQFSHSGKKKKGCESKIHQFSQTQSFELEHIYWFKTWPTAVLHL